MGFMYNTISFYILQGSLIQYTNTDEDDPPPPPPPLSSDGSDAQVRPARRRVVSMDSEADERAPARVRKPRRQLSEIEEDSSITRARRQSMSAGGPTLPKPITVVKGMDPFVAMLPRAHRVLKYRTIFTKLDVENKGNLSLPQVEVIKSDCLFIVSIITLPFCKASFLIIMNIAFCKHNLDTLINKRTCVFNSYHSSFYNFKHDNYRRVYEC
jgi:hypothetical protein